MWFIGDACVTMTIHTAIIQENTMSDLSNTAFEVCHKDSPRVTGDEAEKLLAQIPEWEIKIIEGVRQLQRTYAFNNFVDADELCF